MGLWTMILLVALGAPSLGAFWWAGQRDARQVNVRRAALDGDLYDVEEMLVAFGATKEWV